MSKPLELEFVSSTVPAVKTSILEIYFPNYKGETGVLENHLPYITLLEPGELYYKDINNQYHYFYIGDGFLEVKENRVAIVSDSITRGEDLNQTELKARLEEVEKTIKASLSLEAGITPEELEKKLQEKKKLEIQLQIAEKSVSNK